MAVRIIKNATIVNEGCRFIGSVVIDGDFISEIFTGKDSVPEQIINKSSDIIDAEGLLLIPGVIDDHVHFREPGLTDKADIYSESRAAVKGGTTSFMDMPNVKPQTTTLSLVEDKIKIAESSSVANYSFYLGLTNDNIDEATASDSDIICGLKLFLGSSTGNMLVNDSDLIERLFSRSRRLIAVHSEDNNIIQKNLEKIKEEYAGNNIPISLHPIIRSAEACFKSTEFITSVAKRHECRLHILHVSTSEELSLLSSYDCSSKLITAETCPQYLHLDSTMYESIGARMKCNPAIKTPSDREALISALSAGTIDVIGTDHAPHLLSSKNGDCTTAASGTPEIEFGLLLNLELVRNGKLSIEQLVKLTSHNVATVYGIHRRGFIRRGYYADLVLISPSEAYTISDNDVIGKCHWTPYSGFTLHHRIKKAFVNGNIVYDNGTVNDSANGQLLSFNI